MIEPRKSNDIPVTQGMLYAVRNELKADIATTNLNIEATVKRTEMELGNRITEIETNLSARMTRIENKLDGWIKESQAYRAQFSAEMAAINAKHERQLALYEEQESRNKFVLDGYAHIYERLEQWRKSKSEID